MNVWSRVIAVSPNPMAEALLSSLVTTDTVVDEITDFEIFNRRTKDYLGKINISEVNNTDGISITQQAFPAYPLGLLAVIDDDTSTVGVGWDVIFAKAGLSCGT